MWMCSEISCEAIKLLLAAVVGGIIGFERETHGQAAGLRTNVLVCTGACLLMMLSLAHGSISIVTSISMKP